MPPVTADAFPQFFNATRATVAKPSDFLLNLSAKVDYVAAKLLKGKSPFEAVKGGTSLQEVLHVADNGSFRPTTPGSFRTVGSRGATATLTANYRFYDSHVFWTDFEYNANTVNGTDRERIKNFRTMKDQESFTTHLNGVDNLLFARPNSAKMEDAPSGSAADQAAAYSIPALISEDTVRYRPPGTSSDGLGVWDQSSGNILGQAPASNTWHRNQVALYDPADIFDEQNGILAAFDRLWPLLKYKVPSGGEKFMQGSQPSDLMIFTNLDGFVKLQQIGRAMQRWTDGRDGAMPDPMFDGVPVIYVPQLDTEALEQTRGASANYTGTAYTDPRYFIVNKRFLGPVWNEGNVMTPKPAMRGNINQYDVTVVWTASMLNLFCLDRRRHGIVAPTR